MAAALKKVSAEVEKVTKALENASRKGKKTKQGEEDLDNKSLTALVFNLKTALEQLVTFVGKEDNFCPKVKEQETKTRHLEDHFDEMQQKSLLGCFILSSKANDDIESLIIPEKELKEPIVSHIQTLALTKLNVSLPVEDIYRCHYLQDGSIKLVLSNLRPNSAFDQMVNAIKNPSVERRSINLYFNFMLTRRRNALLYTIRKLKREGSIFKYWSDYDGAITVKKEEGGPKQRITSITTKKDLHIRTYTNAEVMDEFGRK